LLGTVVIAMRTLNTMRMLPSDKHPIPQRK
jgi:hypothetical protein